MFSEGKEHNFVNWSKSTIKWSLHFRDKKVKCKMACFGRMGRKDEGCKEILELCLYLCIVFSAISVHVRRGVMDQLENIGVEYKSELAANNNI